MKRIAEREDLDAVIHLGDYIYEYGASGPYGHPEFLGKRPLFSQGETFDLDGYRARYATYRLDPQLQRAHAMHPFITIWDDHEFANDSWVDGAENHQPETEGSWQDRVIAAKQAYAEWMPIREETDSIYRVVRYGDLLDLVMLDTRIEGRDELLTDINDPQLRLPERTILGSAQKEWFKINSFEFASPVEGNRQSGNLLRVQRELGLPISQRVR